MKVCSLVSQLRASVGVAAPLFLASVAPADSSELMSKAPANHGPECCPESSFAISNVPVAWANARGEASPQVLPEKAATAGKKTLAPVPEPSPLALAGLAVAGGLALLACHHRKA